ncbi:hypothetical protein LXL04_006411 [Taraxacum kok-saghyz]
MLTETKHKSLNLCRRNIYRKPQFWKLQSIGAGSWIRMEQGAGAASIGNSRERRLETAWIRMEQGAETASSKRTSDDRKQQMSGSRSSSRSETADVGAASIGAASIVGSSSPQAVFSFGCKLNGIQKISHILQPLTGETTDVGFSRLQ